MIKYGTIREDGYRFRGYTNGHEMWLSPDAWKKNRDDARYYYIEKRHGLTRQKYDELLQLQNYSCACCQEKFDLNDSKSIHVDHNHSNVKVRGLLCRECNIMIGMSRESIDILKKGIAYLEIHNIN